MQFALSTCFFSEPASGGEIVDKALELGFDGLELGYGLKEEFVPEILARKKAGAIDIRSVHAFSPVTQDMEYGHPELYRIANTDEDARKTAVEKVLGVLHFAETAEADTVVLHAGRVLEISKTWQKIHAKIAAECNSGLIYKWQFNAMVKKRTLLAPQYLDQIRKSLDALLPEFAKAGVTLALENLPSWDALPQPDEMEELLKNYAGTKLACWHDIGHGQVMENAGYGGNAETAKKFLPHIAGTHIHDVIGPAKDHNAPGTGGIDFRAFSFFARPSVIRVFEPAAAYVKEEELKAGLELLKQQWK